MAAIDNLAAELAQKKSDFGSQWGYSEGAWRPKNYDGESTTPSLGGYDGNRPTFEGWDLDPGALTSGTGQFNYAQKAMDAGYYPIDVGQIQRVAKLNFGGDAQKALTYAFGPGYKVVSPEGFDGQVFAVPADPNRINDIRQNAKTKYPLFDEPGNEPGLLSGMLSTPGFKLLGGAALAALGPAVFGGSATGPGMGLSDLPTWAGGAPEALGGGAGGTGLGGASLGAQGLTTAAGTGAGSFATGAGVLGSAGLETATPFSFDSAANTTSGSTTGLTPKEIQQGYRVVNGVKQLSGNNNGGNMSILQDIIGAATPLIGAAINYNNSTDTNGLIKSATDSSNLSNAITADQWDYYTKNYRPAETAYINRAMEAGSPEEKERARGAANADVTNAYDAAGKAAASRMQSFGINPGSPAYQATLASGDLAKGASMAGSTTMADRSTQARADSMLQDVSNMGRGIPSNAAAGLNANAAGKANLASTGQRVNAANSAATGYGLNSVGNLIGKAGDWFGKFGNSPADPYAGNTPNYNPDGTIGNPTTYGDTYSLTNPAFGEGNAMSLADDIPTPFADGGKVDAMDPRSQEAYKRATGDDINGSGAVRNAAQPGLEPQGLTREERAARNAKAAQGPTDPRMRQQMGLPPLKTFARGGTVIDAKRTGKGTYDATGLDSVLGKRGINPEMRAQVITPHMRRFAQGGEVDQQMGLDDGMGDVSQTSQPIEGQGTETSDSIPATIDGQQPAALSNGEFVMSAPVLKMTGADILKAINDAGLQRRDAGLEDAPMNANEPPMQQQGYADGGAVQSDVRKSDRYRPSEMPQSERHRVGDAHVNEFVGKVEKRQSTIQHAQRTPFGWDKTRDERTRNQQDVESARDRTLNYLDDKPQQYARGGRVYAHAGL